MQGGQKKRFTMQKFITDRLIIFANHIFEKL